ncbi:MAG TPA: TadE/TadG family type IV pilus assembly protein [Acidobacteriaceae bacterium]|nr:TadE/TadG family type IV pilus assembly protein [Acidobacteriaceae bacterium]
MNPRRFLSANSGQSLIETALTLSLLILLLAAAVDFGRAYYLLIELKSAAHAGAIYGSQYPTDTNGMKAIASSNATNLTNVSFTPTASWGCECDDGSSATLATGSPLACSTPSCTGGNLVYYVVVNTTASFSPMLPWPGIPSTMNLSETVEMRSTNY